MLAVATKDKMLTCMDTRLAEKKDTGVLPSFSLICYGWPQTSAAIRTIAPASSALRKR